DASGSGARLPPVRLRAQQAGHRRLRLQEELGLHRPAAALRIQAVRRNQPARQQPAEPEVPVVHQALEEAAAAARERARAAYRQEPRITWKTCCYWCTGSLTRPTRATRSAPTTCCATW